MLSVSDITSKLGIPLKTARKSLKKLPKNGIMRHCGMLKAWSTASLYCLDGSGVSRAFVSISKTGRLSFSDKESQNGFNFSDLQIIKENAYIETSRIWLTINLQ